MCGRVLYWGNYGQCAWRSGRPVTAPIPLNLVWGPCVSLKNISCAVPLCSALRDVYLFVSPPPPPHPQHCFPLHCPYPHSTEAFFFPSSLHHSALRKFNVESILIFLPKSMDSISMYFSAIYFNHCGIQIQRLSEAIWWLENCCRIHVRRFFVKIWWLNFSWVSSPCLSRVQSGSAASLPEPARAARTAPEVGKRTSPGSAPPCQHKQN